MKKLLCSIGLHRYKEENFPITKSDYANLALPLDVCKVCGKMREAHKEYLKKMRVQSGYYGKVINPLRFQENPLWDKKLDKDKI